MLMPTQNHRTPIPALNAVCRGTPHEMGQAQGELLQGKLEELNAALANLEAFRMLQPRWMPFRLYRKLAERKAGGYLAQALTQSSELSARLTGMAGGACLPVPTLSLFQAMEPMLSAVDPESARAVAAACSVVAVGKSRSASGKPILGRNFDYLPLVQPFYIIRRDEPQDGLRSLIFSTAPIMGAVDGINESGLCITYNYAYTTDASRPAPTLSMRIAEALGRCRTVEEAAAWFRQQPSWGTGLLMLMDESGDMASLEVSQTRSQLRRSKMGEDLLFHSNGYQSAEMRSVQVPQTARWSHRAPKALRGKRILQSAEARDARFRELLPSQIQFDLDDLSRILADHGPENAPSADTICIHSDYWNTTASIQLLPAARRMRVSYSSTCNTDYQDFEL